MYFRHKIRNRIILVLVILFLIVYVRGVMAYTKKNNLQCQWHLVYAVCKQVGKATTIPSIWQVLVVGVKF